MDNIFSSNEVLYFPTIEFMDESWVKSALTIWDSIYRIVPEEYTPHDSEEIQIAKSNGFIKDIHVNQADLKQTAESFIDYVNQLRVIPDGFAKPDFTRRLHSGKIDESLMPFFKEFSKAVDSKGFYHVHDEIANGYMYFLSKIVSQRRNIAKLTDNEYTFLAMTFVDGENNFSDLVYSDGSPEAFSTLVIENLIPADIRSIGMNEIMKLNKDFSNAKQTFRSQVAEFVEILSKIQDAQFAVQEIIRFKSKLANHHQTKREIMTSFFKELKSSLLFVGVPTAVTALAACQASGENAFTASKACGVISVSGIASLADAGKELRKGWKSQKSSYYLEVKKILTSKDNSKLMIPDFKYSMDQFIND